MEIALATGMRRGEACALRWPDLSDDGSITVSHALGNGPGGFYVKEPKTGSSARTIPLTKHLDTTLSARRRDAERVARETGVALGGSHTLGTQEERGRPYNPTQLGKDFAASCEMNGFKCTFHDLRHTFATMMIAGGCDVRTVASYLGHASVSVTLGIYADVDPDAKRAAVDKAADPLDVDLDPLYDFPSPAAGRAQASARSRSRWISSGRCSPPQRRRRLGMGVFRLVWRLVLWLFRAVSRWR